MSTLRTLDDHRTGAVPCPVRGTLVPIEVCASCQWLLDVQGDDVATVRCAPPPTARLLAVEQELVAG
jgi:hypothetical protein